MYLLRIFLYCYTRNWGYSPDSHVAYNPTKVGEREGEKHNIISGNDTCYEENKAECKELVSQRSGYGSDFRQRC